MYSNPVCFPAYSGSNDYHSQLVAQRVPNGTTQHDEVFWLNIKGNIPPSGKICQGNPTGYSGSKFILYDPANGPGSYDTTGPVPSITGQNARTRGLPTMFLGRFSEPGYLSVISIGDSILDGSGDASSYYSTISGFGFFCRAAVDEDGKNTIATFNLTRHGATTSALLKASNPRQAHFLQYANVAVEEYGTNDLGSNGTGDVSNILDQLEDIWTLCREAGIQNHSSGWPMAHIYISPKFEGDRCRIQLSGNYRFIKMQVSI